MHSSRSSTQNISGTRISSPKFDLHKARLGAVSLQLRNHKLNVCAMNSEKLSCSYSIYVQNEILHKSFEHNQFEYIIERIIETINNL